MYPVVVIREFLGPARWGRFLIWEGDDIDEATEVAKSEQMDTEVPCQHVVCWGGPEAIVVRGGVDHGITVDRLL